MAGGALHFSCAQNEDCLRLQTVLPTWNDPPNAATFVTINHISLEDVSATNGIIRDTKSERLGLVALSMCEGRANIRAHLIDFAVIDTDAVKFIAVIVLAPHIVDHSIKFADWKIRCFLVLEELFFHAPDAYHNPTFQFLLTCLNRAARTTPWFRTCTAISQVDDLGPLSMRKGGTQTQDSPSVLPRRAA